MTEFRPVTVAHDGVQLIGQAAVPPGPGPFPAVLILHTAHGLSPMMRERAARLTALGYLAVAADMYGGGTYFTDGDAAAAPFLSLQRAPELLRDRLSAWHRALGALPDADADRLAAIGFCFGGQCALELARSGADLRAAVSYHGILTTSAPAEPGAVRGHVAVYAGARDPYAPPEQIRALEQELERAGAHSTITVFADAAHGFTDPDAGVMGRPGIAYDPIADTVSWAGTLALLDAVLSPVPVTSR